MVNSSSFVDELSDESLSCVIQQQFIRAEANMGMK